MRGTQTGSAGLLAQTTELLHHIFLDFPGANRKMSFPVFITN